MIQHSHDDYVEMIHKIARELGLKVLKNKQYAFYKPDLTISVGPRVEDVVIIDVAMNTYGILHALGGFYIIKMLGRKARLFLVVLPDDKYMKFINPGCKAVRRKRSWILYKLRRERIKIVPFSLVKSVLLLELRNSAKEILNELAK